MLPALFCNSIAGQKPIRSLSEVDVSAHLCAGGKSYCGLPIGLSFFGTLSVNARSDRLWVKTAKWFIGLLSPYTVEVSSVFREKACRVTRLFLIREHPTTDPFTVQRAFHNLWVIILHDPCDVTSHAPTTALLACTLSSIWVWLGKHLTMRL